MSCSKLKDLLAAEMELIKKHVDNHKWYNKIENYEDGVADFVGKFGWIMRELYCGYACERREQCEIAKEFVPKNEDNNN
jgi:hypothetical protein